MDYHNTPYHSHDTIAAVATAPGEGGVALIRISGTKAIAIAKQLFSGPVETFESHKLHFGKILNAQGETMDEGLVVVMKAPRSYTGEETVEFHCHGGSLITRHILQAIFEKGARPAGPGEFTYRAFLNGKIDLAQAEAVQQVIGAKNEQALQTAQRQLEGLLSLRIREFQKELLDIAAVLEAWVDFPEEDLEFLSIEEILLKLEKVIASIKKLAASFTSGKILQEGLSLCLIGLPNVGKSSLMNALLEKDRSIVTAIPGTTRDVIEDELHFGGLHFKIRDTAGVRHAHEEIEKEGIKRTYKAIQEADLILMITDLSREFSEEEERMIEQLPLEKTIRVGNKVDLCKTPLPQNGIAVSARERIGIELLKEEIQRRVILGFFTSKEELVITHLRHKVALEKAAHALDSIVRGLKEKVSAEFLSSDMRFALQNLSSILGMDITEDILSAIFSKFCVGK